ncbi:MAG: cysteine desulfurase [Bacteroidetes bacterium]|nr:cysteine desulfurase [Bacteroidota bacterium]
MYNITNISDQFPILSEKVNGKPLVYLDNAATVQKPKQVIDAIVNYYTHTNANIHRGVHTLSQKATDAYEQARKKVADFIGASTNEIVFTRGTTESINLVAETFGKKFISAGDEIVITEMEHHSNILPWQKLCEEKGAKLIVAPINNSGELMLNEFEKLLSLKAKLIAITHVSNTLGTINPIKKIIELAHSKNIFVLIDGAQAVPHLKVNVKELDADFYCFSGHKMYAPTGIGALYIKEKWLAQLPTYQIGGGVIKTVSFTKTEYIDGPLKYEAGTPNIAGAIGLSAAIDFMNEIGIETIQHHEEKLLRYATEQITQLEKIKIIGTATEKAGVLSFIVEGAHPFDVGTLLDKMGIAVRTGHHCTQPLMEKYKIQGTVRASFACYNTIEEIDVFLEGLKKTIRMLVG